MSESVSPPHTPEIHPTISGLSDFSDRISPVIVKELRQGMRTRTFTGIFLVLQAVLGFSMLFALMADTGNIGELISSIVFFLFSIAAIILQPLRGISAVYSEIKEDTLEIMSLTRLTSVRIVYGKWASLVSQTALMLAATIPYLVMRYFFGGMQLFAELAFIFWIFFFSACLTGLTVGLSCNKSLLLRALTPLALIPLGLTLIVNILFDNMFEVVLELFSFQIKAANITLAVMTIVCAYIGYYMLDMGVSRIAARAENHAFRKRLISLILMLIVITILFFNPPASVGSVFVIIVFSCAIGLDVCTERPVSVPEPVKPYIRRGFLGSLAGRFFYPGWHSGFYLLSFLFLLALGVGELTFSEQIYNYPYELKTGLTEEVLLVLVGVFYCIFGPLLISRYLDKKIQDPFASFILALIACAILTSLVAIFSEVSRSASDGVLYLSCWIPGVWLLFLDGGSSRELGIILTIFCLAPVWVLIFFLTRKEFEKTAKLEEIARQQMFTPSSEE